MIHTRRLVGHADVRLARFCGALISLDLFFVAVFAAHRIYTASSPDFSPRLGREWHIGQDWSYPEMLGYAKLGIIVSVLGSIGEKRRRPIYAALAMIFATVLLDDALRLHERLGGALSEVLGLPYSSLGELMLWATLGVVLLTIAYAAYVRSPPMDRGHGLLLLGGFAALVGFAVIADLTHVIVLEKFKSRTVDSFFTMVEEGGEQITISLITGLSLLVRRGAISPS